ncbi:hypothetical protein HPB50_028720 [Hyalomma asiaticum]|nr:hypothetical protein HPB50_028720 [Hyalomma asiaticum]
MMERWRAEVLTDKRLQRGLVTLKLNAKSQHRRLATPLSVSGEHALVVVPGRAPLCVRCRARAISSASAAFRDVVFVGDSVMKTASVNERKLLGATAIYIVLCSGGSDVTSKQVVVAFKDHHEPVNGVDLHRLDVIPPKMCSLRFVTTTFTRKARDKTLIGCWHLLHESPTLLSGVTTLVALAQTRGVFSVGAAEGERGHNVSTRGSLTTRTVTRTRLYQHEHRSAGVPENATPCSATDQSTESLHSDRLCAGTMPGLDYCNTNEEVNHLARGLACCTAYKDPSKGDLSSNDQANEIHINPSY